MAWVHLATAPDQMTAEMWVELLRNQGVRAMIHPSDVVSYMGLAAFGCRVQVQEEDIERAREVIGETGEA
jgi:hypothetical protein